MLETDAIPQTNEAQKIEHGQDPTITSDQHQSLFIGLRNSPADMSHARPAVIPHRNHRIICYDHRPIFPGGK